MYLDGTLQLRKRNCNSLQAETKFFSSHPQSTFEVLLMVFVTTHHVKRRSHTTTKITTIISHATQKTCANREGSQYI